MTPEQRRSLDAFDDHFRRSHGAVALILGGSIAHGWASPDSDVDVIAIVTPEEHARRLSANENLIYTESFGPSPLDIKYVERSFLDRVAEHGGEPARHAFVGATVVWSRDERVGPLVERIAAYPEEGVEQRMARFQGQVEAMKWYITQAEKRADPYLATWVTSRAVLFCCRLILAHNRKMFPFHKWLLRATGECDEKPAGFMPAAERALAERSEEAVTALCDLTLAFRDWPEPDGGWPMAFTRDNEWNWMEHEPPVDEL